MSIALQEYRLPAQLAYVFGGIRCRHTGKAGKLVDHLPNTADLAHNRLDTSLEDFGIVGHLFQIPPFETLCRELNRGQRVLDLVRDAAPPTSDQAALRCAETNADTSSKVTTNPFTSPSECIAVTRPAT